MVTRRPAASAAAAACRARSAGRARSCSASTTRRSRCASAVANWWASTGSTACQASTCACAASSCASRRGVRPARPRRASARRPSRRSSVVISRSRRSSCAATVSAARASPERRPRRPGARPLRPCARRSRRPARPRPAGRTPRPPARRRRPAPRPAAAPAVRACPRRSRARSRGRRAGRSSARTRHEVGERLRLLRVEHGAQEEVDERLVAAERERLGRLALLGVHRALVAEQLRVEADVDEVARPLAVRRLPDQLRSRAGPASPPCEPVLERRHRHAAAVDGERQVVETEPGTGPERVPGVGEPVPSAGHDVARPLRHLAGDEQRPGAGVHPLARHVRDVLAEHELRQHVGAGRAHDLPTARAAAPRTPA